MELPSILFEDDLLVAFDKPPGMPVVPDRSAAKASALMPLLRERYGAQFASVHRLDWEASGVVLCAKTKLALDFLSGQFQAKTVRKTYLAFAVVLPVERASKLVASVRGEAGTLPDNFSIDAALGDDATQKGRVQVTRARGAKESITEIRVLKRFRRFVFLEVRPITGRNHQLRVHLAALGTPVLNDAIYGDTTEKLLLSDFKRGYKGRDAERPLISRLAVHAHQLSIKHPATREPLVITAPLPKDYEVTLRSLERFA